ncbi:MAG: hypothetical protein LQ352_002803 [Teloschistes flavicans]|nr:MAG: hypothetical protein LQ352_002803 [Teloschistes flavicans]
MKKLWRRLTLTARQKRREERDAAVASGLYYLEPNYMWKAANDEVDDADCSEPEERTPASPLD